METTIHTAQYKIQRQIQNTILYIQYSTKMPVQYKIQLKTQCNGKYNKTFNATQKYSAVRTVQYLQCNRIHYTQHRIQNTIQNRIQYIQYIPYHTIQENT